jgi:hypothetical protein
MDKKPIIKMKKTPEFYSIDFEKLNTASVKDIAHLFGIMGFNEDYEYFDEIKHLLKIPKPPEPPKSLEELQQELNEKFEELLVKTKRKFFVSQQTAEYHYNKKFEKINKNFKYMKQWGHLPLITLIPDGQILTNGSYLVSTGNGNVSWGTEFNLNPSKNSVGYYYVKPDVKFHMTKTPNIIVRFFMKNLLNFEWKDK